MNDTRSAERRRIDQAELLVREGHAGKAARLLTRQALGRPDTDVVSGLKALHPGGPEFLPALPQGAPMLQWVDPAELVLIIGKMSRGAAPGRSGWTPDLLKAISSDPDCVKGLAHLVLDIINGQFRKEARRALLGSILVALPKPNGKVQPIAMGETFYKLAGAYAMRLVNKEVRSALGPNQYAMQPGGSESAVQTILATLSLQPMWSALAVDVSNAFNSRDRGQILGKLYSIESLQLLWRLADWAYGSPSHLWISEDGVITDTLLSTQGVKQGDPLASFLFSLSLVDIYADAIKNSDVVLVAVQDDVCLLGDPSRVITAYRTLAWRLTHSGLTLVPSKSVALTDNHSRGMFEREGFDVSNKFLVCLGVCVSRDVNVMRDWLLKKTEQTHKGLFATLGGGKLSAQASYHILRLCGLPKMNYWSRCMPPSVLAEAAQSFDTLVLDTARRIFRLGVLSESAKNQMIIPIRMGGFGLSSLRVVSPVAWLCSLSQAVMGIVAGLPRKVNWRNGWLNLEVAAALKVAGNISVEFGKSFPSTVEQFWATFSTQSLGRRLQHRIMLSIWQNKRRALLSSYKFKSADYARLVGLGDKYAGVWLTCSPNHSLLRLDDLHWGMAGRLRLGLPPAEDVVFCGCGANLTLDTSHFLSCKLLGSLWSFRHRRLVGLLSRFANSAGIQTRLEPAVGESKERADIAFSFTSDITLVDVTVVHNQCPTHRAKASRALGLASWAEREKLYQYEAKAKEEGKRFVPVVFETSGGLGTLAVSFLETLCEEMSVEAAMAVFGILPFTFISRALGVQLQFSNANIMLRGSRLVRCARSGHLPRL